MHQRALTIILGQARLEGGDQGIHIRERFCLCSFVLLCPARKLPRVVVARFAIVLQANRIDIDRVEVRKDPVHLVQQPSAGISLQIGQARIVVIVTRHHLHDIKRRPDHIGIFAQMQHTRDGNRRLGKGPLHAEFPLNRMGGF